MISNEHYFEGMLHINTLHKNVCYSNNKRIIGIRSFFRHHQGYWKYSIIPLSFSIQHPPFVHSF